MEQWPQIVFNTDATQAARLESALFASGALSVMYQDEQDQPILEPAPGEVRLWENIRLVGLYALKQNLDDIVSGLTLAYGAPLPEHKWIPLSDRQWERVWMDEFQPMQFGPSLWICPTHCDPVDPDAINVRLDPGLAFGTGTHPTTRQCLEWLGNKDMHGQVVIDYGCGSGVLGVAAALLGARRVIAVDIDPQAIRATQNNATCNRVDNTLEVGLPPLADGAVADTVLANILFQPLIELAPMFAAMTRSGGALVLSGLLSEQIDEVMLRYNQWFSFDSHSQQDSWALLHAIRHHQI